MKKWVPFLGLLLLLYAVVPKGKAASNASMANLHGAAFANILYGRPVSQLPSYPPTQSVTISSTATTNATISVIGYSEARPAPMPIRQY